MESVERIYASDHLLGNALHHVLRRKNLTPPVVKQFRVGESVPSNADIIVTNIEALTEKRGEETTLRNEAKVCCHGPQAKMEVFLPAAILLTLNRRLTTWVY